jgi:hypothetical protein
MSYTVSTFLSTIRDNVNSTDISTIQVIPAEIILPFNSFILFCTYIYAILFVCINNAEKSYDRLSRGNLAHFMRRGNMKFQQKCK